MLSIKSIFSSFVHTSFSVCLQMNGNLINTHLIFINIMNDNLHECLLNMMSLKCSHNSNLSVLLMFSKDVSKPNYCIWLKYFLIFLDLLSSYLFHDLELLSIRNITLQWHKTSYSYCYNPFLQYHITKSSSHYIASLSLFRSKYLLPPNVNSSGIICCHPLIVQCTSDSRVSFCLAHFFLTNIQ